MEDFQRPLDRDLIKQLDIIDKTDISKLIDTKLIKPYLDDVNTIGFNFEGVELTPEQFPDRKDLHDVVQDCTRILHLKKTPRVFIANRPGLNAMTMNIADPIIVLHSSILRRYADPAELRFIVGHEMGHIKCRHVKWMVFLHAAKKALPPGFDTAGLLPLLKWAREAEMSADNAGLICSQDLRAAERALMRLVLNMDEATIGEINVDAFLAQSETQDVSKFAEVVQYGRHLTRQHPFIPDRIREMRAYAKSRKYQHLLEH